MIARHDLAHSKTWRVSAGYTQLTLIFRDFELMHGRLFISALLLAGPALASEPSRYTYDEAPADGYMYAVRYQQAKLACESLPDDLEADYAKAMRLTKEANPEFERTYSKGLAANLRWRKPATPEDQQLECDQSQHALRVTVSLARQWFPGGW